MKLIISVFGASMAGMIVGYFLGLRALPVHAGDTARLETKELVLLDEHNKIAARLGTRDGGGTVLQFYTTGSDTGLELGVGAGKLERFIEFFGANRRVLAGLSTALANGEATLYLGDQRVQARMLIGALPSDEISAPIDEWGIQIRRPGTMESLFDILVKQGVGTSQWSAGMGIVRKDGKFWVAPQ